MQLHEATSHGTTTMIDAVIVPLKRFDVAKARLREGGVTQVTEFARRLAAGVIQHSAPRIVIVLSESDDVSRFAREHHAEVRQSNARDLNEAVKDAYEGLRERFERLLIVHGDLRSPEGIGTFEPEPGITIVTDHHLLGTNVLVLPTGLDFNFSYGASSATKHELEAVRLGVVHRVITDSHWRFDIDEPADLFGPPASI